MPNPVITSAFDSEGAQFAWDSTCLKAAATCQRYYFYAHVCQLQGQGKSVHLIFGGHYARALETYHKLTIRDGLSHDEATFAVVEQTLIETWVHNTKDGERKPGTGHAQVFNSTSKTRANLIRTIIWYLEEYRESEWRTAVTSKGDPAVEHSFKLPLENNFVFCGHLDRVVEFEGRNFVQDQKTTSGNLYRDRFREYDLDIQMSGYTFAGKAIFAIPIKGVMIDKAQVATGYSRFMRGFTHRTEDQLTEWYDNMMHLIENTRANTIAYMQSGDEAWFPQNFTACTNYMDREGFGGCPFSDVCSTPRQHRQRFVDSNFSRRADPWNPLVER